MLKSKQHKSKVSHQNRTM